MTTTPSQHDRTPHTAEQLDEQLDELVGRLSLEQKVTLLTGAAAFSLHEMPGIGLQRIDVSDGPTGVRGLKFMGGERVVLFPSATVLASSWDEQLLERVGDIVGDEAERQHIAAVLGPTINLHRSALGGRLFEQYSEDPLLTGVLAAGYTRGLQRHDVGACLKHFVANESETERNTVNAVVDEKTLRELYLLPFEIAIADADPWMVMASYNQVNGVPATENAHLLREVLRDDWGWDGVVVSDWFATRTDAPAANGGLDLVMPGPVGPWGDALVQAVHEGRVREEVVDEKVRRILLLADRAGLLGGPRDWPEDIPAPDSELRSTQMTELAARGFTLLKNADGLLPLPEGLSVVAVGRPVVDTTCMGGGSATVNAPYQRTIADGLQAVSARLGTLTVVDGVEVRERPIPADPSFLVDPVTGEPGMHARILDADGGLLADVHSGVCSVTVGFDDDFEGVAARVELRARLAPGGRGQGGQVQVGVMGTGQWSFQVPGTSEQFALRTEGHDPGEGMLKPPGRTFVVDLPEGAEITAVVDLTGGDASTSSADNAVLDAANAGGLGPKSLVARPAPADDEAAIRAAVEAARGCDVAVVGVGLTAEQETEAVDKSTLALPGAQDRLVREVAAVAGRTVVVVNAATPVLMPWEDQVDAVLVVGLPGQDGGNAVAKVLLGDLEPSGRLVGTWPVADGATPAWTVDPTDGDLAYDEGTAIGYRGHQPFGPAPAPAHWLGEGLGYGNFSYGEPRLLQASEPGRRTVTVPVTNDAQRDSREVVQVYLRPADEAEPVRLVGFSVAQVAAGRTVQVQVDCDPRLFRAWDTASGTWKPLPDGGEFLVARGLGDIRRRIQLG